MEIVIPKKTSKQERELRVLLALTDYYIQTGRPVGSNTLKDIGFPELSSATIRNYFARLENEGYLLQLHTSGGRVPTEKSFRYYAESVLEQKDEKFTFLSKKYRQAFEKRNKKHAIVLFLQKLTEEISTILDSAIFLTAPRFDHDYVISCHLVPLNDERCVSIVETEFGMVHTEVIELPEKLSFHAIRRIETYFQAKLRGFTPESLPIEEQATASNLYHEIMARFLITYTQFSEEDLFRVGFSKLIQMTDTFEKSVFSSMAIFEHTQALRSISRDIMALKNMKCWIGEDLSNFINIPAACAVVAAPYMIGHNIAGSIGVVGAIRMPYKKVFAVLREAQFELNDMLTRNLYKYKINMRMPEAGLPMLEVHKQLLLEERVPQEQPSCDQKHEKSKAKKEKAHHGE